MDEIIFIAILLAASYIAYRQFKKNNHEKYINNYVFPESIFTKVLNKYPHLNDNDLKEVERGLRQYFHVSLHAGNKMASMPSQVVDEAWHNFILFTKNYSVFCKSALGRFLHHVPAEAMESQTKAQIGIKRTWKVCCRREKINPKSPTRLPLLFSIDTDLKIEDGFRYSLDCMKSKDGSYCAGGIGCAGCSSDSGCGGGCGGD